MLRICQEFKNSETVNHPGAKSMLGLTNGAEPLVVLHTPPVSSAVDHRLDEVSDDIEKLVAGVTCRAVQNELQETIHPVVNRQVAPCFRISVAQTGQDIA